MNQTMPVLNVPVNTTLCFTGHRPEKLPDGVGLQHLIDTLHYYIDDVISRGYTHFLTGLADGIDYYAAEYLFSLRSSHPQIKVIGVQPCEDYREFFRRRRYNTERLEYMLSNVDELVILPGSSHNGSVFLARNRYMVDHASALIAACARGRSGSMQTLNYAKKKGIAIRHIYLAGDPKSSVYLGLHRDNWPTFQSGF